MNQDPNQERAPSEPVPEYGEYGPVPPRDAAEGWDAYSNLALVGVNHRVAPISVRERLAIPSERLSSALERCRRGGELAEIVLLSTCNRFEICGVVADPSEAPGPILLRALAEASEASAEDFSPYLYSCRGIEAVRHVLRVASSLDSLVVGETQILGQVRDAYRAAADVGATGRTLNTLFQTALAIGKRVHVETDIGRGHVSVASIAVSHARRALGSLEGRNVLVVGGGEMASHAVCHLADAGAGSIAIANRTYESAEALAGAVSGRAVPLERARDAMVEADVVVCSIAWPGRFVGEDACRAIMSARRGRPLFVVDIAVPRNVDERARGIEGFHLVDIDELEAEVSRTLVSREFEIEKARAIVEDATERFRTEARAFVSVTTISALLGACHELGEKEIARLFNRLPGLSVADRDEVVETVRRVINKVLHHPLQAVKANPDAAALAPDVLSLFPMIDRR